MRSHPLVCAGDGLGARSRRATRWSAWSVNGRSLLGRLSPGDRVALHWDWVCDVIDEEQAARIETMEARQRSIVTGARAV